METKFEKKYHILEKTHWWFVARRDIIKKIVKKYDSHIKILEIGCSGGQLISILKKARYENIFGLDISDEAIKLCKRNGTKNVVQMKGSELGFKDNEFDLIIASDVLEHINDDSKAISEWKRVLKKAGNIITFVPAFRFLWSDHDVVNKHFRRYGRHEFLSLFETNELQVVRISYWNFLVFFPIAVERFFKNRRMKHKKPKEELFKMDKISNLFFLALLKIENIYCNFFNFPVGLSLFLIARK